MGYTTREITIISTRKGRYGMSKKISKYVVGKVYVVKNKYHSISKNQNVEMLDNIKTGPTYKVKVRVLNGTNRELLIPTDYLK